MIPAKIFSQMQEQYGDSCLSHSKIYEWENASKMGKHMSVMMGIQEDYQHQKQKSTLQ